MYNIYDSDVSMSSLDDLQSKTVLQCYDINFKAYFILYIVSKTKIQFGHEIEN
jgi:hypothetical protein